MKITGMAPGLTQLYGDNCRPYGELEYLAAHALLRYHASSVITSLYPGWDQALAKTAMLMGIPLHVAFPYREWELILQTDYPTLYNDLLPKAKHIECLSDINHEDADGVCHLWRAAQADQVLALWDYEFCGDTFEVIDYALKNCKGVVNLWEDWSRLYGLRKNMQTLYGSIHSSGAQIFPS